MKASFPTVVSAVYMGVDRREGDFVDRSTGELVKFGAQHSFQFDAADGTVQVLQLRESALDQIPGFRLDALERWSGVTITGEVVLTDKGGFFRPLAVEVTPRKS